ncbi:MAG: carboxypeptidase M32, partial [Roseobacter sp.]
MSTAYSELLDFARETQALAAIAGRQVWDQETMMPKGAAPQRGREVAALESVLHARRTDPRVADWLAAAGEEELDTEAQAQIRLIRRSFDRASKVPAKLAAEIARVTSEAQGIWADARAQDDFAAFAPTLETVIALKREEGDALAAGGDVYDAMLQDYEPGTSASEIVAMFGALRPELTELRAAVLEAEAPKKLSGSFDETAQMRLARKL